MIVPWWCYRCHLGCAPSVCRVIAKWEEISVILAVKARQESFTMKKRWDIRAASGDSFILVKMNTCRVTVVCLWFSYVLVPII